VATLDVSGLARQRSLPGDTSQEDVDRALEWIAARTALAEVRVVGGDPLLLADAIIERIMGRLAAMPHVTQIRWATRTLVTLPMRITPALAGLLGRYHEPGQRSVVVLADVVSALEVTPELVEAAARLRCQGVDVHNHQRVGLPWSRRFEAVAARPALARAGVEARGRVLAAGEETPFARVLQERREEARLLPGRLRAEALLVDAPGPGGRGRVEAHDRELAAIRSDGRRVYLVGCSAEEGPRIHVDASIADYLDGLAARGEDPEDYASLWRHR
jgi:lysine 2,3-aminomutase